MHTLIWLLPALPLTSFVILAVDGRRMPRRLATWLAVCPTAASAALAIILLSLWFGAPHAHTGTAWTWFDSEGLRATIGLSLDALSLVMTLIVTIVAFLILLYSSEFMQREAGYSRFFAYMNLFVGAMLVLVLADNLLLLYLGWEGVGLCSYLLIGFWYQDRANIGAARKAFIVTRIGDISLLIAIFVLWSHLGSLRIDAILTAAARTWSVGSGVAVGASLLILGGAVGKSAQLPLQVWLPDAMAGPTPVSALIHAATMVTAGVYLIARTHVLFALAPATMTVVAVVGAATLLIAGFSAIAQRDIKRLLAYSTISQVGYMFLALGVGAWSAAIFHLMTHAFFKALLFLAAGAVIHATGGEHDLLRMGGLRRDLPVTFWTFLVASASMAAVPLLTAGFYSKDLVLWRAWSSPYGGVWLWIAGLAGALLTAIYIFRAVFLAFFGPRTATPGARPGARMKLPMLVLAGLSVIAGFIEVPRALGGVPLFSRFLAATLPATHALTGAHGPALLLEGASALACFGGITIAYVVFLRRRRADGRLPVGRAVERAWRAGFGFDALYQAAFVTPYRVLAHMYRHDPFDDTYEALADVTGAVARGLSATQTGRVRTYVAALVVGALILLAIVVLL